MNRRQVAVALCGAAIVYACAPRNRLSADQTAHKPAPARERATDTTHALALTVSEANSAQATVFAIEFKNHTKQLTEMRFASGRTHEFVVLDEQNREVWRWSTGRLFTQSLQTKQLKTGDALRFEAKWDKAAPGRYRVIASLNSTAHSEQLEQEFVVH